MRAAPSVLACGPSQAGAPARLSQPTEVYKMYSIAFHAHWATVVMVDGLLVTASLVLCPLTFS